MGGYGNVAPLIAAFDRVLARPLLRRWQSGPHAFPYGFHRPADYVQWLAQEGLVPTRTELVDRPAVFTVTAEFAAWIRTSWHPYLERVPKEHREALLSDVVDEFCRDFGPGPARTIVVPYVRLEVEAYRPEARALT